MPWTSQSSFYLAVQHSISNNTVFSIPSQSWLLSAQYTNRIWMHQYSLPIENDYVVCNHTSARMSSTWWCCYTINTCADSCVIHCSCCYTFEISIGGRTMRSLQQAVKHWQPCSGITSINSTSGFTHCVTAHYSVMCDCCHSALAFLPYWFPHVINRLSSLPAFSNPWLIKSHFM